jgi:hypothetical protein
VYIILLGLAVSARFMSGKWKNIKLVKPDGEAVPRAFGKDAPAEPGHAKTLTAREAAGEALAAAGTVDGMVEAPRE